MYLDAIALADKTKTNLLFKIITCAALSSCYPKTKLSELTFCEQFTIIAITVCMKMTKDYLRNNM